MQKKVKQSHSDEIILVYKQLYKINLKGDTLQNISQSNSSYYQNLSYNSEQKIKKISQSKSLKCISFFVLLIILIYIGIRFTQNLKTPTGNDNYIYENFRLPNLDQFKQQQ